MSGTVDYGDPKDWPGLMPGFENVANDEERDLAALEPAWGKAATFFRTGHRFGHPRTSTRCMSLADIYRQLGVFKTRFEAGDTLSLLQAVRMCAEENLPLPTWLATAFQSAMDRFLQPGQTHSLDQVFASRSIPSSSPSKAAQVKIDWQLGGRLYHEAWSLAHKDETVKSFDMAVERVLAATGYGVGKTKAKALILKIERNQSQFLDKEISLSRFLAKRRKLMTE